MLNLQAFAEREGVTIGVFKAWVKHYGLPYIKFGGRIYIDDKDYTDWINAQRYVTPT